MESNERTYKYPWDKGIYGLLMVIFLIFVYIALLWDSLLSQPSFGVMFFAASFAAISLGVIGLYQILVRAPNKFIIKNNQLIAVFHGRKVKTLEISRITRIVENKRTWFSPFSITIVSESTGQEFLLNRYLRGFNEFLETIQRLNSDCRVEVHQK